MRTYEEAQNEWLDMTHMAADEAYEWSFDEGYDVGFIAALAWVMQDD